MKIDWTRDRIREIGMHLAMGERSIDIMTPEELNEFQRIQVELRATTRDIVICHLFKTATH